MESIKAYNSQNAQVLSFHPISSGGVASATWRLAVLSRMLSPCFLIGAPLQHGRMRLTEPRGFRGLQHWVWLLDFFPLLFVDSNIRYMFHIRSLKELDLWLWPRLWNKLWHYCFPVTVHQSTVTRDSSSLCCESRLYPTEKDKVKISRIIAQLSGIKSPPQDFSQTVPLKANEIFLLAVGQRACNTSCWFLGILWDSVYSIFERLRSKYFLRGGGGWLFGGGGGAFGWNALLTIN